MRLGRYVPVMYDSVVDPFLLIILGSKGLNEYVF